MPYHLDPWFLPDEFWLVGTCGRKVGCVPVLHIASEQMIIPVLAEQASRDGVFEHFVECLKPIAYSLDVDRDESGGGRIRRRRRATIYIFYCYSIRKQKSQRKLLVKKMTVRIDFL